MNARWCSHRSARILLLAAALLVGWPASSRLHAATFPFLVGLDSQTTLTGSFTGYGPPQSGTIHPIGIAPAYAGTLALDDATGNVPGSGQFLGGTGPIGDFTGGPFGIFVATLQLLPPVSYVDVSISLGPSPLNAVGPVIPGNPGTNQYAIDPLDFTMHVGTVSIGISQQIQNYNFNAPLSVNAPGQISLGPRSGSIRPLTIEAPVHFSTSFSFVGNTVNATISGRLVLTGGLTVPEPGTISLLLLGCLASAPMFRRLRRAK